MQQDSTYTNDVLRASLGREHTQDAGTTADIEDDLVLEQVGVLDDSITVRARTNAILQHLFVDT